MSQNALSLRFLLTEGYFLSDSFRISPPMKNSKKAPRKVNIRWFLLMNMTIALLLVGSAIVLKNGSSNYNSQARFDSNYIALAKAETNAETLKHGIIHTEAARATAYRSVLDISNGASITWILLAVALLMNAMFIFRMQRNHQLILADATSA